uniref:hypothetical protein n=1 Tax=Prevotella sp. TaxID=59823 RepID=UPI0040286F3F
MKKITKFLDSVMGGIKRTCVAKALAVFAVASIAINVNAQTSVIPGVDQLVGKTEKELYDQKITVTKDHEDEFTFPTDFAKHFFLYNVKTGRFLNVGGYWGTHVSLKEYGEPLAIVEGDHKLSEGTFMKLVMEMDGTEGKYVGWFGVPKNDNPDVGVFVDRKFDDVFGWHLEPVKGKINTYKLYTYPYNRVLGSLIFWDTTKKYYLCSNKGSVDVDVNCGAFSEDEINKKDSEYAGYDEWRFLSYEQIRDLQNTNADNMKDALELSFKLRCPGFSRGDNDIKKWNTYNFKTKIGTAKGLTDEFARYGLSNYYNYIAGSNTKTSEKIEDAPTWKNTLPKTGYEFDGRKYDNSKGSFEDYRRHLGKYYTASITNKRGIVYQDVEVSIAGRYQIECKGYSTTKKASLFAGVLNSDNSTMKGKAKKDTLNQVSNMSQDAKEKLHVLEHNVDYAGKNFYGSRQYINTVYVTVTDEDMTDGKAIIRFGIMVGDKNDANQDPEGDEWTVFDDFRILYAAKDVKEDLILDECREDLSYLVNSKNPMENKTLHLNKTFTLDKWNSFILPVNLNKTQVLATFGANARLAKLTRLLDTGIEFTSVDLLDDNSTAIEAYVPYIIFPKKNPGQTEAYTASYEQQDNQPLQTITIAANHYVIGKVSKPSTGWSKMNQSKWKWATSMASEDGNMEAWGTFARTFGEATQDKDKFTWDIRNKSKILDGRCDLKDCYFFANGNMYHSKDRARGLRGFSCWFQMAEGVHKTLLFTLDGVSQGTTGIEDILADYEQPVSRFANGIYNLNGQLVKQGNSTAGLPSGMYIVNGKKCIVR